MSAAEATPTPAHLASEFYAWLWWTTESEGGVLRLGGDVGEVVAFVDSRLAFRNPNDTKVAAVMTGDDAHRASESRAALSGGKVVQEVRLTVKRDDRAWTVTLRGPEMVLGGLKLPQEVKGGMGEEVLFERMHLYEEATFIIKALFTRFCEERDADSWEATTLPTIATWMRGEA